MPVELSFRCGRHRRPAGLQPLPGHVRRYRVRAQHGCSDRRSSGERPRSLFGLPARLQWHGSHRQLCAGRDWLAGSLGAGLAQLGVQSACRPAVRGSLHDCTGPLPRQLVAWAGSAGETRRTPVAPHSTLGQTVLPIRNPGQAFLLGAVVGLATLRPGVCGGGLVTDHRKRLDAAVLMLGFGLGTLPAMLLAGNAFNYLKQWVKAPLLRRWPQCLVMALSGSTAASAANASAHMHRHQHHGGELPGFAAAMPHFHRIDPRSGNLAQGCVIENLNSRGDSPLTRRIPGNGSACGSRFRPQDPGSNRYPGATWSTKSRG